jgi:hypothetical protein
MNKLHCWKAEQGLLIVTHTCRSWRSKTTFSYSHFSYGWNWVWNCDGQTKETNKWKWTIKIHSTGIYSKFGIVPNTQAETSMCSRKLTDIQKRYLPTISARGNCSKASLDNMKVSPWLIKDSFIFLYVFNYITFITYITNSAAEKRLGYWCHKVTQQIITLTIFKSI